MSLTRRAFLNASLSTAGSALVAPYIARPALAADTMKVGAILDMTGGNAVAGEMMLAAMQIAADEVNNAGGLLGKQLEIQVYDAQNTMQLYSQYAQQAVMRDKVVAVHGGLTSASREAIRPVFDRAKTLYFYNVLYEGGVCDRNVVCTGTTPAQTLNKLVPHALGSFGKKVYILGADYNYGQITAKWMAKYAREGGGKVLGVEFFPLDVSNFTATISKIQQAGPDVVLSALVGSNHTAFYRQWAAAGLGGKIGIAATTFGGAAELQTMQPDETNGIVTGFGYYEELQTPASVAFVKTVKAKKPSIAYVGEIGATSYEGMRLWIDAVKAAGTVERDAVVNAIEGGLSIDGPTGKVTLDAQTHHTIRNAFLGKAVDGKWDVFASFPDQHPSDTAAVCDLKAHPNDAKQYVVDVSL
jgi:urea ABC transporter substrate-binding protein